MLLGVGAMVAAARSGAAGNPAAAILGPQEAIRRSLLSYQRAQEEQADRAGVKFLTATGQSAKGMYDTFKRLADQILFAAHNADPYLQSHPMPARTRRGARSGGKNQPVLGQERSARAAAAARPDARQALRLPRPRRHGRAPLSVQRQQPAGALRARDRDLSPCRPARRHRPDRRPDPGAAEQSLFPRAQGPGAAGRRQARRGDRAAAARGAARAAIRR